MLSEEAKVINEELNVEPLMAFRRIPYSLINAEIKGQAKNTLDELTEICRYYEVYKKGAKFVTEGTKGDYVPSTLKYKTSASLINKEARFLFAEPPDINIKAKGDAGKISEESKVALTTMQDIVNSILKKNKFEEMLIKAAKDCFIGKRVAGLINFNPEDGVTVTFLPSTQFIYETKMGNPNVLSKFVCFTIVKDSRDSAEKVIFKKKFELIKNETTDKDEIWLEEETYDGAGKLLETITEKQTILLDRIPASIFINDGLTGEEQGESEVGFIKDFESYYSKLSNADKDAERKSMNPIIYTVDMESNSTKNLSSSAGSKWDLGSDQNLDKPAPSVGMLEPSMNYSSTLDTTLKRIKTSAYEQVDMPDIESIQATITSGKALKAIYWPLIVRCKEKMKMWGPQLSQMVEIIIEGSIVYPDCITRYTNAQITPVDYEIEVVQNTPLPEDETEEKTMDLSEVETNVMSKKSYMKKWRGLTDDEVQEELEQIALERQLIEDATMQSNNPMGMDKPFPEV